MTERKFKTLRKRKPKGYVPYPQRMTIPEIVRECKRLGITYGEFQARRFRAWNEKIGGI